MRHSTFESDRFQRNLELRAQRKTALTVLAVDDDPDILKLLQSALPELENCKVVVAGSADEALLRIEAAESPFDCLLVDIQMPETSGIDLLSQIRNLPDNRETPVIMLTALDDRQNIERAFLEGAFDYITKPFDFFELRSRMNAAHLLMRERKKTQSSSASIESLRSELDFNQKFSFEDPLSIDEQEQCVGYVEFDNYVEQLSRGRRFDSWVTAIKFRDAEYHFDLREFGDFRRAVSDIGFCIQKTTQAAGGIYSYRGSGVFLVITHGRERTQNIPTEAFLNQELRTVLSNRCASAHLKVVKSTPVSLRSITKVGAFESLNMAVKMVNLRETNLRKGLVATCPSISKHTPHRKEMVNNRLFDTVLREMYGDDTYLTRR
ncbi:two-component system response regulator [uncultured Ruegeria sp.]|uniref:response regulator n=1 Tax=uncultured Ruegeria sp. TaxID=259304 RepID=UPI00260DB5F6|nr:response regulator [uncultured Ruegeria sp.]